MKDICRLEIPMSSRRRWRAWGLALLLAWSGVGLARVAMADEDQGCPPTPPDQRGKGKTICFNMVPSGAAATCLPNATARVRVKSMGPVEMMQVDVAGLPPNTGFDFFVMKGVWAWDGVLWYAVLVAFAAWLIVMTKLMLAAISDEERQVAANGGVLLDPVGVVGDSV